MSQTARSTIALLCALAGLAFLFGCEEDTPTSLGVTIIIDANPKEIDAPWTLVGPGGFSADGAGDQTFRNRTAGEYTLTWQEVDGYILPSRNPHNQKIQEGRTFTFSATYTADFVDVVRVEPKPADVGATWELTGPSGFFLAAGGDTLLLDMEAGGYSIVWNKVIGRSTPADQSLTLQSGGFISFVGEYNALPETDAIIINSEPDIISAPWTVTGPGGFNQSGNGDTTISDRAPGEYTLTWGNVVGYVTPAPAVVSRTLVSGDVVEFSAEYSLEDALVLIASAGDSFTMGTPIGEPGRQSDETQHTVLFTKDYYLAPVEVTQAFWNEILTNDIVVETYPEGYLSLAPSYFDGCPECPVESISWSDALKFCNAASLVFRFDPVYSYDDEEDEWSWDMTKNGYRLPTEAEWEYACRAGTATSYYNGSIGAHGDLPSDTAQSCFGDAVLSEVGWFCDIADSTTHPAQGLDANGLGLYDMHGNVFEWCWDTYGGYHIGSVTDPTGPFSAPQTGIHVMRGGSWQHRAKLSRSGFRGKGPLEKLSGWASIGFRLARNAD